LKLDLDINNLIKVIKITTPEWILAKDSLSESRINKVNKNFNNTPRFIPSDKKRPKYSRSSAPDDIVFYERTGRGAFKEELDPPPWNSGQAYDKNFCIKGETNCKDNGHKFRYLEQNMTNHKSQDEISFLNKDGQILFNRSNCYSIHRNQYLRDYKIISRGRSNEDQLLENVLYKKNLDLYEDEIGIQRLKESIEHKFGSYYFDRPKKKRAN
tara:strand:- start:1684 stop:2319 length:636 start_codon:yes stop_codon:yes gene_type:complete